MAPRRQSAVVTSGPGAVTSRAADPLWNLEFGDWKRFVLTQPPSFWFACTYLFLEYVRPQSIYPAIDVLPWAQLAVISTLVALLLEHGRFALPTPISKGLIVFTSIALASCTVAFDPGFAWRLFKTMYLPWMLIYILIVNSINTERRFLVFWALFLLSSLKMSQHAVRSWAMAGFAFRDWGVTGAPGWFHNSGEFGIQMCVFLPMSLYTANALKPYLKGWRLYLAYAMPASALIGVMGSSSRGALVGMGLIGLWMIAQSRRRVRLLAGLVLVSATVWVFLPAEQRERFSSAGEDNTSIHRMTMWKAGISMANQRPALGVGFRNFVPYYRANVLKGATVRGTLLPHNIFIEAWSELGYLGLFAFLGLIIQTFALNRRTRRLAARMGERGRFLSNAATGLDGALVGYIGSGFFVTVLYYPYFWINLALTVSLHISARDSLARSVPPQLARTAVPRNAAEAGHSSVVDAAGS